MRKVCKMTHYQGLAALMATFLIAAGGIQGLLAQSTARPKPAESHTSAPAESKPVDVNSADAATLETLPGIGQALAKRIIAGRPYHNLSDLGKIKGLSQPKLDALKDHVTFGPAVAGAKETQRTETSKPHQAASSTGTAKATAGSTAGPSTASKPTGEQTTMPAPSGSKSGQRASGQKININTATAAELDALPGIGPAKAQAILDYRNQHGAFKTIEEIENVKGIKAGEFSKLKDHIKVGD